ncbi:MAG TPA: tyrosine-protein phosphatase [Bryobacteraceae bacterium]|nr:tyrosine-protein phosphatase [Bryobacteraceae bacterium]
MIRTALLVCALIAPLAPAAVENAVCEQTGPASYRLSFEASGDGPVTVYASSSAGRIDTHQPVAVIRKSPADVSVPGRQGRIYFHLKPENGPTRVVSIRRLPLEGAINFRDLGGYRTKDGKYVRWGMLYRSDHLVNLTEKDYAYLNALGIKTVCDLRTGFERERSPTAWQGKPPEFLIAPVGDDNSIRASLATLKHAFESGSDPSEYLRRPGPASVGAPANSGNPGYADMLFAYRDQFARVLHRIVNTNDPALTHCSGGADRTGIYSALLLETLGVPRGVVVEDYLLTRRNFLDQKNIAQNARQMQSMLGLDHPPDPAFQRRLGSSMNAERLETMFSAIDAKYGSFDAFLKDGLRISETDVERLRRRLLEP